MSEIPTSEWSRKAALVGRGGGEGDGLSEEAPCGGTHTYTHSAPLPLSFTSHSKHTNTALMVMYARKQPRLGDG